MSTQKRQLAASSFEQQLATTNLRGGVDALPLNLAPLDQPGYAAPTLLASQYLDPAPTSGGATGTLAVTESGADVLASAGNVFVQGTQSATESGADTLAVAGYVFVQGAVSLSEAGADVLASSGGVIAQGAMALSEVGSDAFGSEGDVFALGSMSAVEDGGDALAASGAELRSAAVGGGSLSYEDAEAIHNRQIQRRALPDVDAQPQQKRRTEAQGATEGPSGEVGPTLTALAPAALPPIPSLADVRARIAEAQAASQRAALLASAIELQRMAQDARAAELAEEEAVAMLILNMEAA